MSWKVSIGICGVILAACAMAASPSRPGVGLAQTAPATTRVVPHNQTQITLSFSPVVKQTAPAVVNIYTRKIVERRVSPFRGDPFFERFFGQVFPSQRAQRRIENSLGSGVILQADGIVVSNHHVVAGADEITVVLQDRREYQGKVVFADKDSDLAVVKLDDASDLPVLSLRDSDTLEVGDLVLAIGNPFGVGQTVTSGIVSGLARSGGTRNGGPGFLIQTDAAINPGNSGGALVDMEGRLIGVNTSILSKSGGSNGIGFAVPANLVAKVVQSALAGHSELVRPWFGMDGQQVGGELANALGLETPIGVLVDDLHRESPLAKAGLSRGDVLTLIDDAPVNTVEELDFRAATKRIGTVARIGFLRDGKERVVPVKLLEAPERPARDQRTLGRDDGLPGLTVVNINPAVIDDVGLPVNAEGVLVVNAQGAARRVGLRRGDVIREVNAREAPDVRTLSRLLKATRGDVEIELARKGRLGQVRYRR